MADLGHGSGSLTRIPALLFGVVLNNPVATVAACVLLWYITTAIWSIYHLRNVPGPWLAKFSYLWYGRTTYSGRQYYVHRDLHKQYGPLVRVAPNEVLTEDPDIVRMMSAARGTYSRGTWYLTGRFNPYHDNMFTILEPKAHSQARARKIGGYSGRDIPSLELNIGELVTTLVDVIRRKYARPSSAGSPPTYLDLGSITNYFTLDVITRLAFGQEMGYLKDDTDHFDFFRIVRSLWPQMSTSADVPWIRKLLFSKPVLRLVGPRSTDKNGFGALMRVAEEQVQKRFDAGVDAKKDMIGSFIRNGCNQQECEVEGLFMIVGGTESTASALRCILTHIMTCPRVYQRLIAEIAEAVASNKVSSPITVEQAKSLPFLQAAIYEGIRMRPPLLGVFPKVVPAGGVEIAGHFLPAGTNVGMNISAMLRSTVMFGLDSDMYRPERFMDLEKVDRTRMERNVELAFGHGLNMCVGKTIAFMELNKAVFELLQAFDLQLVNPMKPCDSVVYGIFLETNLMVRVTERNADKSAGDPGQLGQGISAVYFCYAACMVAIVMKWLSVN